MLNFSHNLLFLPIGVISSFLGSYLWLAQHQTPPSQLMDEDMLKISANVLRRVLPKPEADVSLGSLWAERPVVVVFLRRFG